MTGRRGGFDVLALDELLLAVALHESNIDVRNGVLVEERQQVLAQLPLVVLLRLRPERLGFARRPPARREIVERDLTAVVFIAWRRRLPHARADLGEDVLEFAFGPPLVPAIGIGSEREAVALSVDPKAQAEGEPAINALVHADLPARAFLHVDLLVAG